MAETDYSKATVLLFDPVHANLRTTRYTLNEIGFKRINCVSQLAEFDKSLTDLSPDLIVAECGEHDAEMFDRIRKMRRSELGSNPFSVILLTTWLRDRNHIRSAIECGADDLIVRPFSTVFAEDRIRSLVKVRKDFIVTSDYVGPDRRGGLGERPDDVQALQVPNMLQATVTGDAAALSQAVNKVNEARKSVEAERVRRIAMRMVIAMELQLGDKAEKPPLDLADLDRTVRDLRSQLTKSGRVEAAEIAGALHEHLNTLAKAEGRVPSNLQLAKELAMGAYAAYADGDTIEKSKDEIARTVTNLRKRIQQRAQQAASLAEQAELKRAAM